MTDTSSFTATAVAADAEDAAAPPIAGTATEAPPPFNWRVHLRVHPAAELFPLMKDTDPAGLEELASDIEKNGLRAPLVGWASSEGHFLLDGRNRLDALALLGLLHETHDHHVGLKDWTGTKWSDQPGIAIEHKFHDFYDGDDGDPYAIALSLNVHRRHLTPEQRRDLLAKLIIANPDLSDRQLGKMANASKNTAAAVRGELESRGQIDHVETRKDSKGRNQPARRSRPASKTAAAPGPLPAPPAMDEDAAISAEKRKRENAERFAAFHNDSLHDAIAGETTANAIGSTIGNVGESTISNVSAGGEIVADAAGESTSNAAGKTTAVDVDDASGKLPFDPRWPSDAMALRRCKAAIDDCFRLMSPAAKRLVAEYVESKVAKSAN
jgi:hypothetical protein